MKKNCNQQILIGWLLATTFCVITPTLILAMDEDPIELSETKKNRAQRLIALYKETRDIYNKKKKGDASQEELEKLKSRMKALKKEAVALIGAVAFFAAVTGITAVTRYLRKRAKAANTLVEAARNGNLALVQALLDKGQNKEFYYKALYWAAKNGHLEIVRLLLQHNAYINPLREKPDPLFAAAENGRLAITELLLPYQQTTYPGALNPLYGAVKNSRIAVAELLLNNQFDANLKSKDEIPLIHVATKNNDPQMVELLLKYGANPNQEFGNIRWTALHVAAKEGNPLITKILLVSKAQQIDSEYGTPLYYAALSGNKPVVEQLLLANGDPNIRAAYFPLHATIKKGHIDITELLINRGARINTKNNKGNSALHIAARKGDLKMLELLISKNANLFLKNNNGLLPLDIAKTSEIKNYLQEQMNKSPQFEAMQLIEKWETTPLSTYP